MELITFGRKDLPCLVFLHGWGGGFSSFSFFAKELSDKYFCVVVDFNSTINSGKILWVSDFSDELKNELDLLGAKDITIIAHSFGGRVTAKFYEKYPGFVKKIVLIDSAGLPKKHNLWYYIKVRWFKFCKTLVKMHIISKEKLNSFGSPDYVKLNQTARKTFINIISEDLTNSFSKINVPTLIYWGENDKETPLKMAKTLKKIIKPSELIIEKDAGHFSYLTNPQKFIRIIRCFMEEKYV